MEQKQQLLEGMDVEQAFALFTESDNQYRITLHCGRAEAARRQRVAGEGTVTDDGYVRETHGDFLATYAEADDDATVEVIN